MSYAGIDYGRGQSNVDIETGCRFGIIGQSTICQFALDDVYTKGEDLGYLEFLEEVQEAIKNAIEKGLEAHVSNPKEKVGQLDLDEIVESMDLWDSYGADGEAGPHLYQSDRYSVRTTNGNELFVLKSPYYTWAQFCSPCVPGAGNLDKPLDKGLGAKAYCLGPDWFEDNNQPYPVYSVETDELVYPAKK